MKVLLALLFLCNYCVAQNKEVQDALQIYAEYYSMGVVGDEVNIENEDWLFDIELQLSSYLQNPLKINSCTYAELLQFPLFTVRQVHHLKSYQRRYGDLRSVEEIGLIPQFPKEILEVLSYFIDFSGGKRYLSRKTRGKLISTNKYSLLIDTLAKDYLGSAAYHAVKIKINDLYPGVSLAINSEKDKGELWYHPSHGLEHINFNVGYTKDISNVRRLVIGDYKVSFGQGLLLHTGYNNYKSRFLNSGNTFLKSKIKSKSSNDESSSLRGVAAQVQLSNLLVSTFVSCNNFDAAVKSDTSGQFFSSVGNSGIHLDQTQLGNKDQVNSKDIGLSVSHIRSKLNVSWNHLYSKLSIPFKRKSNYYNTQYFLADEFYNQSVDFNFMFSGTYFFGEVSADKDFDFAIITGLSGTLADIINYRVLYRNYFREYQSFRGKSYQQNGQLRNEKGMVFQTEGRFGNGFTYNAYYDFYVFPQMSYRRRFAAVGKDQSFKITYNNGKGFQCYAKVKRKMGQKNVADNKLYQRNEKLKVNYRLNYRLAITENIKISGQFEYSKYSSSVNVSSGTLFFQEVKHVVKKVSYNIRFTLFSIDDYNARIYVYEPSLKYSSPFSFYKNHGFSSSLKSTYTVDDHFKLSIKLFSNFYQNKESTFKSYDAKVGLNVQGVLSF